MQSSNSFLFTSESVGEGHPDKVCDFVADSILDAHLEQDPRSRVACEVLCKHNHVVLAGEITSRAKDINYEEIVRRAIVKLVTPTRRRLSTQTRCTSQICSASNRGTLRKGWTPAVLATKA